MALAQFADLHDFWIRFWRDMDRADYAAILARLTTDCLWLRDRECRGHTDILTSLQDRPSALFCRHLVTNFTCDSVDSGWNCIFDLLSFGHITAGPADLPPYATTGPKLIAYSVLVVQSDGRLKASALAMNFLFDRLPTAT